MQRPGFQALRPADLPRTSRLGAVAWQERELAALPFQSRLKAGVRGEQSAAVRPVRVCPRTAGLQMSSSSTSGSSPEQAMLAAG